jgi:hypothetical protein
MRTFLILFTLLISLPSMAIDQASLQQLLKQKGTSLEEQSRKGNKAILGEVTGHAKSVPLSKVVIIVTEGEAILKQEIEGTEVSGAPVVGNLQSVRFNGQYVPSSGIVGVIIAP